MAGLADAVAAMSADHCEAPRLDVACQQLTRLLNLTSITHIDGPAPDGAVHLRSDGEVEIDGTFGDIDHYGLPLGRDIDLDVVDGLGHASHFAMRAGLHSRPWIAQRLAAVAVAHWAVEVPALR